MNPETAQERESKQETADIAETVSADWVLRVGVQELREFRRALATQECPVPVGELND